MTTIIGPNGAGKSTLLRAVYGVNKYFGGSVRFLGRRASNSCRPASD